MSQSTFYFLIGCIAWATLLYIVFIVRRAEDPGAGGKSALVIVLALIIPILVIVLWNQVRSFARLEQQGFAVFEGLDSSVGVAAGVGADPTWLYSLRLPEREVLDFYRQPENHPGWKLVSETQSSLTFRRGVSEMRLELGHGNAAFLLFNGDAAKSELLGDAQQN